MKQEEKKMSNQDEVRQESKQRDEWVREYSDGDVIIQENETGNEMYVILSGKVKVVKEKQGVETILAILKEEDIFGEMSLFDNRPRSATVKAIGRTKLAVINRESFLEQIKKNPNLAIQILQKMTQRIRHLDEELHNLSTQLHFVKDFVRNFDVFRSITPSAQLAQVKKKKISKLTSPQKKRR